MKFIYIFLFFTYLPSLTYGQTPTDFKPQLKKLADDITQQLKLKGNKRLAVASFTDQQNNVTELGKYLAQQFSVYLIRNGLDVVDRSRIDVLMEENNMSSKGLLDPKNQTKLGELANIELIVVGTTTPSDKYIELVISAINIARGTGIAGTDGSIPRTISLNDLMRSTVKNGGGHSSSQETPSIGSSSSSNQEPGYILMGDKSLDLKKETCFNSSTNYGQICFENILKQPVVLYLATGPETKYPNVLIGSNARNYTPLLYTGANGKVQNASYEFYFHTTESDESNRLYGKLPVIVEGCKVIVRVINTDRLFLSKNKP